MTTQCTLPYLTFSGFSSFFQVTFNALCVVAGAPSAYFVQWFFSPDEEFRFVTGNEFNDVIL